MTSGDHQLQSAGLSRKRPPRWILVFVVIVLGALAAVALMVWMLSKVPAVFESLGQRQLAAVRSEIHSGMSRQEVYARLKARNLIAMSTAWGADSREELKWPPTSFTAVAVNGKTYLETHPEVYVTVSMGSRHFGCGTGVDVTIDFDDHDLVKTMGVSLPQEECM
jgi:hypothetical protein